MDVHLPKVRAHVWHKQGALVKDMDFEWRLTEDVDNHARVIAGGLDNGNALFNDDLGISCIVGRVYCRQQGYVDTKWFGSHRPATADPISVSDGGTPGAGGSDSYSFRRSSGVGCVRPV